MLRGSGRAIKNHAHITWTDTLNLPLFTGDSLDSCNYRYTVEAAILHSGPSLRSVRTLHHCVVWDAAALFCDDNVAPQRLGLDSELRCEQGYGSREVYLLVCRRGEARH